MPATIDDSAVLTEIAAALQRRSSRAESNLEELRNEVRNRAFSIWERRIQGKESYFGNAWSDRLAAPG
jgi:predicted nucleic acid-binding protein